MSGVEDKALLKSFISVGAMLVGATVLLFIIANVFLGGDSYEEQQQLAAQRAEANLQPIGEVRLSGEPMPEVASAASSTGGGSDEPRSGEQVVQAVCIACHQGGFMNAPAIGDKDAWAPRIDAGLKTLISQVHNGYGNMPAQGNAASDDEIRKAILWMVEEKTGLDVPKG